MQYNSHQLITTLREQNEQWLSTDIRQLQQLKPALLNASPAPGRWSAAQCLEHLNSYSRYYLPAMEKAMQSSSSTPAETFNSGWLGNYFYRLMLPGTDNKPIKKMKSPKAHAPIAALDAKEVVREFIDHIEQLAALLARAEQVNLQHVKVPISIAPFIRLRLGDVLLFFTAHIQRHLIQAKNSLPKSADQTDKNPAVHAA